MWVPGAGMGRWQWKHGSPLAGGDLGHRGVGPHSHLSAQVFVLGMVSWGRATRGSQEGSLRRWGPTPMPGMHPARVTFSPANSGFRGPT